VTTADRPEVVIVGAGPYGLSIAAHLRARRVPFRIFGTPMRTWTENMPKGMFLKSDGFASNLSDPEGSFTLKRFCESHQIAYDDKTIPVRLETFVAYGVAFQQRFVPELEDRQVVAIDRHANGFGIQLDNGETTTSHDVVLAVGITHFHYVPENLSHLPPEYLSHSSAHSDVQKFRGRNITVIGGGASAIDVAALAHESGAAVTVVARRPSVNFHNPPDSRPRSLWQRLRNPSSGIGQGFRSRFYTDAAWLFHRFPEHIRLRVVARHLGPAAGWPLKQRVVGRVPFILGSRVERAEIRDRKVHLALVNLEGARQEHVTEHVIAATGYRVDLRRLKFLSDELQSEIRSIEQTPILSSQFQASVPGLYFVGVAAANSFGPVLRFAFGADFVARRISKHLATGAARRLNSNRSGEAAK
jgi:thioredoxin reductase